MLIVFPTLWNDGIIQSQMSKPRSRGEEFIQIQRTQRFDIWGTNNVDQKDKVWDGSLYSILRFHYTQSIQNSVVFVDRHIDQWNTIEYPEILN